MNAAQVRKLLASLDERLAAAQERVQRLREEARAYWAVPDRTLAELGAYHRAVFTHQRKPDLAEARRLTAALCETVLNEGLIITPVDPYIPAAGLRVADPAKQHELNDAIRDAAELGAERAELAARHAELLAKDEKRARMKQIRTALDGDDPDALREALAEPHGPGPLTTDDLRTDAERPARRHVVGRDEAARITHRYATAEVEEVPA